MKKLLLIAALAAVALGANAGYTLEKVWEINDVSAMVTNDVRAGFGMDGKIYINDKGTETIYIYGENGVEGTLPGTTNCGITRDEAGNILVSTAAFPGVWGAEAGIKVINPTTGESVEYIVPEECGLVGRCDFIGFAKGNFFEDGVLYLTGGNYSSTADPSSYTDGVAIFTVTGGEVDYDNCYLATVDGATSQSSLVINYYKDLNGDDALIYAYRSGYPSKLTPDGDNFEKASLSLPAYGEYAKGHNNGAFPFIWDGKELIIYPLMPDYRDGWAIAEAGAEEPIVGFAPTAAANPNAYQANWLNAEVDADGVTIYQYMPGLCLRVFRLTKEEAETPDVYILGEVNDKTWAANDGVLMEYDAENNVYTATVTLDGRGASGENYFSFTTELANDNDDGGWSYIQPFRFGAVSNGDFWFDDAYLGQELSLTYDNGQAFRVMQGEYNVTVDLANMKVIIDRVAPAFLRGDVDMSGDVKIGDVTALINYLLSGDATGINLQAADCDQNGEIKIGDVTTLINFLLSGSWE